MSRQPLVLLLPGDHRAGLLAKGGLEGYGYDVLMVGSVEEALDHLRTNRRISVLVVNVELENATGGMALAKAARTGDPSIHVIYTCGIPYRIPEREKVKGAPCLRTPYHPHQLVSVIGQISTRYSSGEIEKHAA
jgi:CheY-like chemotaxis protein